MVFSDGLAETGAGLRNVVNWKVQLRWTEGAETVGMIVEEVILGLKKRDLV